MPAMFTHGAAVTAIILIMKTLHAPLVQLWMGLAIMVGYNQAAVTLDLTILLMLYVAVLQLHVTQVVMVARH